MPEIILHIPHASTYIPQEYMKDFLLTEQEMNTEFLRMVDYYTDELYQSDKAIRIISPVSRLLIDMERFIDDELESMNRIGMGVLYTKTHDMKPLRNKPSDIIRNKIINEFYKPHHEALDKAASNILNKHGKCLIADCHSFLSKRPIYEKEYDPTPKHRPQICIGSDDYHTPKELTNKVVSLFKDKGYEVDINTPFAGSLIPNAFYGKDNRVCSFMIETRRDLYMNEETGEKLACFNTVKEDISQILQETRDYFYNIL